jgi:hypothetical protein
MSMSQCTNFVLKNGKEEIKVFWDLTNGEFSLQRTKLPQFMSKKELAEVKNSECSNPSCPNSNHAKNSFYFRANELDARESMELNQIIQRALLMLLGTKDKEEIQEALGFAFLNEDEDDDDNDY